MAAVTIAVILEPKKIKFVTFSIVSPSIFHEVIGPDAMILVFFWEGGFFFLFYFIFDGTGSSLLHMGVLYGDEQGLLSGCGAWTSYRSGFSCCGAQALGCAGFCS